MRKLLMSSLIVLGLIFHISNLSYGVPAAPVIHTLTQADGSAFEGMQWGDESYHGWETLDGYTIVFDESLESWAYAMQGNDGSFVSSAQVVGKDSPPVGVPHHLRPTREFLRTGSRKELGLSWETSEEPYRVVPATGTANVPVVLMNFSDTSTTYTSANFNTLLFGTGNFSMKDYYQEVSYGKFSVAAGPGGVVGWYKGSKTREYYGKDTDPNDKGSDACPGDLVYEAAAAADAAGFDFAAYDNNGDCYVDILVVVHQGRGQDESADTNDIWSHRWNLNGAKNANCSINQGEYTTNSNCTKGGKIKVNDYFLGPETNSSGMTAMGVFAHEFGHALGLPDLYDTDGSSNGIGYWSLMASGSWNKVTVGGDRPAHPDAWSKYKLGWVAPTLVTGTLSNEAVTQAATAADVYQCPTGSPSAGGEYFLVENRQKSGFDVGLPGAGLLIYHIDESKTTNKEECYPGGPSCSTQHYKVALEQADGQWHLEKKTNKGDAQDPYASPKEFTDTTSPGSKFYSDTSSNFSVTAISASGSTMTATMSCGGTPPPQKPNLTPYKPSSWSDKIVVSNKTGTNTDDSPLYITDTLYVDWAVINNGAVAISTPFYTKLYVDGAEKNTWSTSALDVNYYTYVQDYSIGTLSAGTHTLKIVTDATGVISESNELDNESGSELDNEYTKTITVNPAPSCSSLYFWDGDEYVYGRSLFPGALFVENKYRDYVPLRNLVPKDGGYSLRIMEEEQERAFIDMVYLVIIDRSSNGEAGVPADVGSEGSIIRKVTLYPSSATHSALGNVRRELLYAEDKYVRMDTGDILTLTFPYVPEVGATREFIFVAEGFYIFPEK